MFMHNIDPYSGWSELGWRACIIFCVFFSGSEKEVKQKSPV
jgi:hypothetical protein